MDRSFVWWVALGAMIGMSTISFGAVISPEYALGLSLLAILLSFVAILALSIHATITLTGELDGSGFENRPGSS